MSQNIYLMKVLLGLFLIVLGTRLLPFFFLHKVKDHPLVKKLAFTLPPGIIFLLVIYCLGDVTFLSYPYAIPEILAIAAIMGLHLRFKNLLVSLMSGIALHQIILYMFILST